MAASSSTKLAHYDHQYQVVVVGCNDKLKIPSWFATPVIRHDDAVVRLEIRECLWWEAGDYVKDCSVLVIYYSNFNELAQFRACVLEHVSPMARIILVYTGKLGGVMTSDTRYCVPLKDPATFFTKLKDQEGWMNEAFWNELASGPDYTKMKDSGVKENFQMVVSIADSAAAPQPPSLQITDSPEEKSPSRCSVRCEIL